MYNGISVIDVLVLSHSDLDHIGGANSVLEKLAVDTIVYSAGSTLPTQRDLTLDTYGLSPLLVNKVGFQRCVQGSWIWDDVTFEFIYPSSTTFSSLEGVALSNTKNNRSCVLKITAQNYSVLIIFMTWIRLNIGIIFCKD